MSHTFRKGELVVLIGIRRVEIGHAAFNDFLERQLVLAEIADLELVVKIEEGEIYRVNKKGMSL